MDGARQESYTEDRAAGRGQTSQTYEEGSQQEQHTEDKEAGHQMPSQTYESLEHPSQIDELTEAPCQTHEEEKRETVAVTSDVQRLSCNSREEKEVQPIKAKSPSLDSVGVRYQILIHAYIQGKRVRVLVDTGASVSLIESSCVGVPPLPAKNTVCAGTVGGGRYPPY